MKVAFDTLTLFRSTTRWMICRIKSLGKASFEVFGSIWPYLPYYHMINPVGDEYHSKLIDDTALMIASMRPRLGTF